MTEARSDLARITLSVIFIGGLIAGAFWVLQPFLGALVWATMVVIATWPLMRRIQRLLWGKRGLAVVVMTLLLLGVLILPLGLAVQALLENLDKISGLAQELPKAHLPPAPDWLSKVPVVGERAAATWTELAGPALSDLLVRAQPYLRDVVTWFGRHAGSVGLVLVQFLLTVVLAAVLYGSGESWADWVRQFARRLAGDRGDQVAVLASQAVRGVALGVVLTALIQSVLGGIGLAIAGVPFASVLTGVMFMLCIAQLGPVLVLLAATVWVYMHSGNGWAVFMLVWTVVIGLMDNFIRPVLIRRGADLPFLLILSGVIGGLVAFGLIGIFVGPVVLAVAYTLLDDWVAEGRGGPQQA